MNDADSHEDSTHNAFVREVEQLQQSRGAVLDIIFCYPEDEPEKKINPEDVEWLRELLPSHHFSWLSGKGDITVKKLDDFFSVSDDFCLNAEELLPDLKNSAEKWNKISPEDFINYIISMPKEPK